MANHFFRDKIVGYSAGVQKSYVHPLAIEVMQEISVDISGQKSKTIKEVEDIDFDLVVTLCDNAKKMCPVFPGKKVIHLGLKNPYTLQDFMEIRDILKEYLAELVENKVKN